MPHPGAVPLSVTQAVHTALYATVESIALDLQTGDDISPALHHSQPVAVTLARFCEAFHIPVPPMLAEPPDSR